MSDSSAESSIKKHRRKRKSRHREKKSKIKKKSDGRKRRKKEKYDYSSSDSRSSDDRSLYVRREKKKRKRHRSEDGAKLRPEKSLNIKREEENPSPSLVDKEVKLTSLKEDLSTTSGDITKERNDVSASNPCKRSMVPMTKEEYEKQQNIVREVYDPQSGRYRLVRGTGEIIERIVSRNDHQRINQIARRNDGLSFSMNIANEASKRKPF